jgi:hypothetical protein
MIAGLLSGCDGSRGTEPIAASHNHPALRFTKTTSDVTRLANEVRGKNARYHSTKKAAKAGYAEASPCVSSPAGGMGFHWVNGSLVDPVFDADHPEALLYAPDKHGKRKLVGVEYIVVDIGQPAPTFAGQPFDVGGAPLPVPHWTLHVWLYQDNPSGLFNPWNPDVVCP